jgi:hypothetical protein
VLVAVGTSADVTGGKVVKKAPTPVKKATAAPVRMSAGNRPGSSSRDRAIDMSSPHRPVPRVPLDVQVLRVGEDVA